MVNVTATPEDKCGDDKQEDEHARRDANDDRNLVLVNGPAANHPGPIERRNHGRVILNAQEARVCTYNNREIGWKSRSILIIYF